MIRVCDLMHKGVLYCYPDDSAQVVADMMETNRIRSVAVVDESGEEGLVHRQDEASEPGRRLSPPLSIPRRRHYRTDRP